MYLANDSNRWFIEEQHVGIPAEVVDTVDVVAAVTVHKSQ